VVIVPIVSVIGIGFRPLDRQARESLSTAELILASDRLLDLFRGYEEYEAAKNRIRVINRADETIAFVRSHISRHQSSRIVILASGDPLFFGIGRRISDEFGKGMVEMLPDLSSVQAAFARIKEPWDNAFFMSLHGGPDPEQRRRLEYDIDDIPSLLIRHPKIAILTDREKNPSSIAAAIAGSQPSGGSHSTRIYVCEKLGYPDEKITQGSPEEIEKMMFSDPNVVIVMR
jgi:precorrin-6Y C5,15-methyltransferase (decarboxylating)